MRTLQTEAVIDESLAHRRLDIVVSKLSGLSKRKSGSLIKEQGVGVDGRKVRKAGFYVEKGQTVKFNFILTVVVHEQKKTPDPRILFDDAHIVVIEKPSGMLCQPSDFNSKNTVTSFLRKRFGELPYLDNPEARGLVHRIDREASGIVVCAKTEEALSALYKMFKTKDVDKTYVAVCHGNPEKEHFLIDAPLEMMKKRWKARAGRGGKASQTIIDVSETVGPFSILVAKPLTGRTHQIRAHLAHHGLPIVCDEVYGKGGVLRASDAGGMGEEPVMSRLCLHATRIRLLHPMSSLEIVVESPVPQDISRLIDFLRKRWKR